MKRKLIMLSATALVMVLAVTVEAATGSSGWFFVDTTRVTIWLEGEGGITEDGHINQDIDVVDGESVTLPTNLFKKKGYEFVGWALTSRGEKVYDDGATVPSNVGMLFALWRETRFLISFNANGGSGGMDSVYVDAPGQTVTLPMNNGRIYKDGHVLIGWSSSAGGYVEYADGATAEFSPPDGSKEVVLFAKWELASNVGYMTFVADLDKNGHDWSKEPVAENVMITIRDASSAMPVVTCRLGDTVSLPGGNYKISASYSESKIAQSPYWRLASGSGGYDAYALHGGEAIDYRLCFRLVMYTPYLRVTYDSDEGEVSKSQITYSFFDSEDGMVANIWEVPSVTQPQNYEFLGWWTTREGPGVEIKQGSLVPFNTAFERVRYGEFDGFDEETYATTFFARWKPKYSGFNYVIEEDDGETVLTSVTLNGATSVTTPSGVTVIGSDAFSSLDALESVTISDGVTSIGDGAFWGCIGLKDVTISGGVTNIHPWAFDNCSSLVKITVDAGNPAFCSKNGMLLTKDGKTLVQGVNGDVAIPNGVVVIGDSAFYGCSGLTSVTIPNSVTTFEKYAFGGCSGLKSVTVPKSVTSIANYVFDYCGSLVTIAVDAGNPAFCSKNGMLLTKDGETLLCGVNGDVVIPSGVVVISDSAFYGRYGLKSVTIPDSVTTLEGSAFGGCIGLTSVVIPNSVTSVGGDAFYGCSGLERVTIGSSVTEIGVYAFSDCENLMVVRIPRRFEGNLDESVFEGCPGDLQIIYYDHPLYTVRFHKNDGSDDVTAEQDIESCVATRLTSLAKLGWAKRGLDFVGWGKYPNSTVVWKQNWANVTDLVAPGETVDLYAIWAVASDSYAIEYWRNDGAGTWRWVGFKHGVKTRMPSLANGLKWARRGYAFKGWELTTADANDNTRAAPWKGDWAYVATPVAKGKMLTTYARWALKPGYYQIRFNRNDGGGKWRTLGFECGKSTKLSTISALGWARDGYEFVGWASSKANADAGKLWKPDGAWVTNAAAEGKTLSIYAIWRKK